MASIVLKTLADSRHLFGVIATLVVLHGFGPPSHAAPASDTPSAGDGDLFDRLDVNHNDTIAANEISSENRSLFDRLLRRGDSNDDQQLSRTEFLAALVPTRPAKPLDVKEPSTLPQANAVRYLLLKMDTNRNARIEKDEVPSELEGALDRIVERMDRNGNGGLEREELNRGGPAMAAVAGRYVERLDIDVDAELAKLKKSEGNAFNRFEQQPVPLEQLRDPKQARQLFAQIDVNSDGKLDPKEVPAPLVERMERLTRVADRDRDGKLSQDEFVAATDRLSRFMRRGQPDQAPPRDANPNRRQKPADTDSAKK